MLSLEEISDRLEIQQLLVDYSTSEVLPNFPAYSHLIGNFDVRLNGDEASSRILCFNPMVLNADGQVMFCGLWYDDEFVRTADGWRMTRRVETKCFDRIV
jgi:hypothetical protein